MVAKAQRDGWGVNAHQANFGLRPLKDMPKFKQLLSDPKYNAPLY